MSTSPASTASTTARCAPWPRSAIPTRWNSPTCASHSTQKLKPRWSRPRAARLDAAVRPSRPRAAARCWPGRAAGGSDWIGLRRNEGPHGRPASTSCRCCRGSWWRWQFFLLAIGGALGGVRGGELSCQSDQPVVVRVRPMYPGSLLAHRNKGLPFPMDHRSFEFLVVHLPRRDQCCRSGETCLH